jgi:hypothetical protein
MFFTPGWSYDRHKIFQQILHLIHPMHCVLLCLLARFVAYNCHLPFHLSFRSVHASAQLLFHVFLLTSLDKADIYIVGDVQTYVV